MLCKQPLSNGSNNDNLIILTNRILDPPAWLALTEEFERRDHPYSAEGARVRLAIFQHILSEEESSTP